MARTYFYVVSRGIHWAVEFHGQQQQYNYRTQAEAIDFARGCGRALWADHGTPSGVRIQDVAGQWRDESTYGHDPFPPRG